MPRQIASIGTSQLERGAHDGELDLVVLGDDAVQLLGRRRLAVVARVHVATAVQHHGIDPPQQVGHVVDEVEDRRQHQRRATGAGRGVEVATAGGERLAAHALGLAARHGRR